MIQDNIKEIIDELIFSGPTEKRNILKAAYEKMDVEQARSVSNDLLRWQKSVNNKGYNK